MELTVVIPVFNEEDNLASLFERLKSSIEPIGVTYEFIFINDGSRDNSLSIIRSLASKNSFVHYIDFSRNFGHQVAVSAGIDHASGNSIVIIDADLQDPPELIRQMYDKMKEGFEVVYARRRKRAGESFMKKITARVFYRLLRKITSIEIPVDTGDFRIMHRKVAEVLKQMPEQEKYLRGQIAWVGFNQTYVEYDRDERQAGNTGYSYKKMLSFALDGITSFSNVPLRFATIAGFFVAGITFVMSIYALYARLVTKNYVPGWTSLLLTVLFIGGIQLISIGIIGEYISRLSRNTRNRPLYVIRETNVSSSESDTSR